MSLIVLFFDGKNAKNLSMIELYTVNTARSAITLSSLSAEKKEYIEKDTY